LTARELRPYFRGLYRDAGPLQRQLAAWRPSICPYEPIVRFVPAGARALDFGCGSGALLALLAATGRISAGVGCDISQTAIGTARQAEMHVSCGDALEFRKIAELAEAPPGPFDLILIIDVLHHIPRAEQEETMLAVAGRVRSGGTLIYKDMAMRPAWRRWANTAHDLLVRRELVSYVPACDVERWLQGAGFVLAHAESYARLVYAHELRVFRKL
jgi:2-polyprenyl-3-methyl-5-hydroxy-6-metoxy-1,4-benzoquinol methylase